MFEQRLPSDRTKPSYWLEIAGKPETPPTGPKSFNWGYQADTVDAQFNEIGVLQPEIYGAGLTTHYILAQLHFHWGSDDQRGSEHTNDDRHYPLEVHMVHRRSTDSDAQALIDPVGMAVISVLFDVANGTEPPNKASTKCWKL